VKDDDSVFADRGLGSNHFNLPNQPYHLDVKSLAKLAAKGSFGRFPEGGTGSEKVRCLMLWRRRKDGFERGLVM
jgi:hypothetical protein